ncbi:MAG: mannose-1-phosphate guanylyltransferase [Candidatus Coatesbacteria bacterium]|nr:mannose-1-phosphate guanylyltransferase [Candidatus Coatesbacteria bacterium]
MNKSNTHIVIIAGGKGQRFWPLSRQRNPKQLLPLGGKNTLLEQTIERVWDWVKEENIWIIANNTIIRRIKEILGETRINILSETIGRDTAAAIGFASCYIKKRNPDAVIAVLPSDHYINDRIKYLKTLEKAVEQSEKGKLTMIGFKPTFAATQYGYLKRGEAISENIYKLKQFCEKPTAVVARQFLETGEYYWNSGIFIWSVDLIMRLYKDLLPDLYNHLAEFETTIGTKDEQNAIDKLYNSKFKNQSVDFGIMEPAILGDPELSYLIEADFSWNDVGNWTALECLIKPDFSGNIIHGKFIGINSRENIVWGNYGKLIAGLGLENIVIIDTEDALLVANKNELEQIKNLHKKIDEEGWTDYL